MSNEPFSSILGISISLGGLWMLWWGSRLWRHPEDLRPGTVMYRYFLTDWRTGPRTAASRRQGLTHKRIRYYGVRVILGGALALMIGVALIVT